jgi:hypothetical protein
MSVAYLQQKITCQNCIFYKIKQFVFRIAYSVFEVDRLLASSDATTKVKIMYDIGCTLSAHLKVRYLHS